MNASGTSLLRASVPFLFIGWLASLLAFAVNDLVVPGTTKAYERIRRDAFRSAEAGETIENVAVMDAVNRLYHARQLDLKTGELSDLTILEHDRQNRPVKSLYAARAVWTKFGWLLLHGAIYRVGPGGVLRGDPEPFVARPLSYPVSPAPFSQP